MIRLKPVALSLFSLEWLILWGIGPSDLTGKILTLSLFLFSLWQLLEALRYRQIWFGVMQFFMLSYAYEPLRYFCFGENISRWRVMCQIPSTVYTTALLIFLFLISMYWSVSYKRRTVVYRKSPFQFHSDFSLWFAILLLGITLTVVGKTGQNILQTGGYGRGGATVSTTFSYAMIPLIVALCYATTSSRFKITMLAFAFYVVKDLLYGGRIDSIMLLLIAYMVYFRYKLTARQTIIMLFAGFFCFLLFGVIRGDTNQDIHNAAASTIDELSLSTGNSQDVYYASMRIIYLIQHGILDFATRLQSFICFLLSLAIPYSKLPPEANLASYMVTRYNSGGGGLAPIFIYAWLSYPGVIAAGVLIGKLLTGLISSKMSKYAFFFGCFAMATTPRWYAYYPITLVKLCVFALVFFMITEYIRTRRIRHAK